MSSPLIKIPKGITTKFSVPAWLRKVNPFTMGTSGDQYVPNWLIRLFSSSKEGSQYNNGTSAKVAHVLDKTVHGAALLAALALGTRAAFHWAKIDNIDNVDPSVTASGKLNSDKSIDIDPVLNFNNNKAQNKKKQNEQQSVIKQASVLDPYHTSLAVLPFSAALLAALAVTVKTDKMFDKSLGKKLDKDLYKARLQSDRLAKQRILTGRGITQQTPQNNDIVKTAGLVPKGLQGPIALLWAALTAGGFAIGFNYQRDNSKPYAKYKANKKGLEQLLKNRSQYSSVASKPLSQDFIDTIDSNLDKNKKGKTSNTAEPMKQLELI